MKELSKSTKVILTIVVVVLFIVLSAIIIGIRSDAGNTTSGVLAIILFALLIFALRFIWEKQ